MISAGANAAVVMIPAGFICAGVAACGGVAEQVASAANVSSTIELSPFMSALAFAQYSSRRNFGSGIRFLLDDAPVSKFFKRNYLSGNRAQDVITRA
jgi:hypothetical protein